MIYYIILTFIIWLLYHPALNFYFAGDDFSFLAANSLKNIIFINPYIYHYLPIPWLILLGLKTLFFTNPLPYHVLAILIHLINSFLVFNLSRHFIKEKIWRLLTTIFFIIFFANFESIFWITGIYIALSLTFFLIGFKFFLRFLGRFKIIDYIIYAFSFLLSILSHEYGITLIFFCFFYLIFCKRKVQNFKKITIYTLVPITFFIVISILKIFIVKGPLMASPVSIKRFLASLINFYSYVILPNPYFWDLFYNLRKLLNISVLTVVLLIFLSFFFILAKKNNKNFLFLFSWITVAIILFSVTSWPQMRYFYFLAFPISIMWINIIKKIENKILLIVILMIWIFPHLLFLQQRSREWLTASQITKQQLNKKLSCEEFGQMNWTKWIGDDRWKAYVITNPEASYKFLYGLNCNK